MWKLFIKCRLVQHAHRNTEITQSDILAASSIIFSVFARYGDSVMAFKAINEFISRYPQKSYIMITSPQLVPYARKIIAGNLELHAVNKRKNPVRLLMTMRLLSRRKADLGLNPWSHGDDSVFFITFARKFHIFGTSFNVSKEHNLYMLIRKYLLLEPPAAAPKLPELSNISSVLISPFSTDVTKSLGAEQVDALVNQVKHRFPSATITVALQKKDMESLRTKTDIFVFGKSLKKSEEFLKLLLSADLFISVDAGPLHLADALGIRTIGIFGPTAPESILDNCSSVLPVRHNLLNGIFCFVEQCKKPACISEIFKGDFFSHGYRVVSERKVRLETERCPFLKALEECGRI